MSTGKSQAWNQRHLSKDATPACRPSYDWNLGMRALRWRRLCRQGLQRACELIPGLGVPLAMAVIPSRSIVPWSNSSVFSLV